ncbi:MerR family transcriptional regulator [Lentzea cavernae]|uniref:MerR family transcriptional regulator n=1 Tax=Lentzea cavernae TaxID=2020703 RepID=A0ABQ3MFM3_9PSEU|nr:MerR family transcriptional regulator [Lentzea cavernae]GHH39820.1 MerR family transcriptional regulator [Lentzea cavernae]
MLSGELAELAGVTVRTLRHYHQIGLLPEPPRSTGGYRHYDVGHLVRLLRITRMTALGLPLSALPAVLDDQAAADELLDELDRQAAADVERLTARRAGIAALRGSGAPPDLPPELLRWHPALAAGVPDDMARYEHEQLLLAAHLLGPAGVAALFGENGTMSASAAFAARFYALGPETPDDEVASLVDDLVAHVEPLMARLADLFPRDPRAAALMDELSERMLEPVQHQVLRQVQQRLGGWV